jgi:hypothetical protein
LERRLSAALVYIGFVPLLLPAFIAFMGILTGKIDARGLWRDSFRLERLSPARVYQVLAVFAAAGAIVIGLFKSGGRAFAPLPQWLFTAAGGGNFVYLASKFASSRMLTRQTGMED